MGPRALLQFGSLSPKALAALLFWRKWMFDIDNRAAQETGYLLEPIIASAIGGTPVSAARSPVRRSNDASQGRQVDCILEIERRAYEFKLRVTTAASGQGRWNEELMFPADCKSSGYRPILIVLDPTQNHKLAEIERAFRNAGGEAHSGAEAWRHLEDTADPTMAKFLERYVRSPLDALIAQVPSVLPDLRLSMTADAVVFRVGDEVLEVRRSPDSAPSEAESALADDVDDGLPG